MSMIALLAINMLSCSEDDKEGNGDKPTDNVSLQLKGATSTVAIRTTGITFSEAIIHVEGVEFESKEEVNDYDEVDFKGPFVIDLLTGVSNPEIPMAGLYPATYDEVEVELIDEDDNSGQKSIVVKGTYGADDIVFEFSTTEDFEFEAEADDDSQAYLFEVIEGKTTNVVMEFQLANWFKGVDFTTGTLNENGKLIISETENKSLYDKIAENIDTVTLIVSAE